MSTFKIPNGICKDLDALVRKFWWEIKLGATRFLALKSWKSICQHKDHGVLGFRKFKDMNLAFLEKLAWKIASGEEAVWADLFIAKYLKGGSLFSYKTNKDSSHVWKGIVWARKILNLGACYKLGDGVSINHWLHPWVPSLLGFIPSPKEEVDCIFFRRVGTFKYHSSNNWNQQLVREMFSEDSANEILKLKWPHLNCEDKLI